jgi:hypothetical protein
MKGLLVNDEANGTLDAVIITTNNSFIFGFGWDSNTL